MCVCVCVCVWCVGMCVVCIGVWSDVCGQVLCDRPASTHAGALRVISSTLFD